MSRIFQWGTGPLLIAVLLVEIMLPGPSMEARPPDLRAVEQALASTSPTVAQAFPSLVFGVQEGSAFFGLRRWTKAPRVALIGSWSDAERSSLVRFIDDHVAPALGPLRPELVEGEGSIRVEITDSLPASRYWAWWDASGSIQRAEIHLAADQSPSQRTRDLQRQLVRVLGFLQEDGAPPPGSVLGPGPAEAGIDRKLLSLLYDQRLPLALTADEYTQASLQAQGTATR